MKRKAVNNEASGQSSKKYKLQKQENLLQRKSNFLSPNMRFMSVLPEVTIPPKLLYYPYDNLRFFEYKTTSLENNYKHQLFTEPNLGLQVDLVNPSVYDVPSSAPLDPKDALLLSDESVQKLKKKTRSKEAWLRTNIEEMPFQPLGSNNNNNSGGVGGIVGDHGRLMNPIESVENIDEESFLKSIEEKIEKSFVIGNATELLSTIQHPTNPKLKAVGCFPVQPNNDYWGNLYLQVQVDCLPMERPLYEKPSLLYDRVGHKGFMSYYSKKNEQQTTTIIGGEEDSSTSLEEYSFLREFKISSIRPLTTTTTTTTNTAIATSKTEESGASVTNESAADSIELRKSHIYLYTLPNSHQQQHVASDSNNNNNNNNNGNAIVYYGAIQGRYQLSKFVPTSFSSTIQGGQLQQTEIPKIITIEDREPDNVEKEAVDRLLKEIQ